MTENEKMIWMFKEIHGDVTGSCYIEIEDDEDEMVINVMKDNNLCWSVTKNELVFDYLTRHLDT